jgi:gliding motility-associated-like protein
VNTSLIQPGEYTFVLTTSDNNGGSTIHNVVITFGGDQESVYEWMQQKPVNEYADQDVLGSGSDADGNITSAILSGGNLPPGVALNAGTGQLSVGQASLLQPGSYTFQITTTDAKGGSTSQPITITVLPSNRDLDNDSVLDIHEDINQDGDLANDDTDGDGVSDYMDADDDGDGILTLDEDLNNNNDPRDDDSDGDGIPNYLDDDDDGDGIPTAEEDGNDDGNKNNDDCDQDGIVDYLDADMCGVAPEKGFSPNGDGNNEFWTIRGIEYHPDNEVSVFNRWGNLVYETKGYNNGNVSWQGQVNGKLSIGSDAPDGTYFYVVKVAGAKAISGYVIIKR